MLSFKPSTFIALAVFLTLFCQTEATEAVYRGLVFPNLLYISPVYKTKNPSDTFAQACESNTLQLTIETQYRGTTSIGVCDIDLNKIEIQQHCPLTDASFYDLAPCGNVVVVVKTDAETGTKRVEAMIEVDFSGTSSPPMITRCLPFVKESSVGGSRKLRKRWDTQKTMTVQPFECPKT